VIFAIIAVGILFAPAARMALILATVVGLAIWVIGENFGGILTGQGTDPNSGLLLILLIAAYWPLRARSTAPPGASPRRRAGMGSRWGASR
jgi:hypothetical protein